MPKASVLVVVAVEHVPSASTGTWNRYAENDAVVVARAVTLNFVTATSTDQAFAAVSTDPILYGPFAVGANPAGFIAGVVVGGFMNLQQAQDPDISAALGASLGTTGDTQSQALTQLNTLLTERGWYVPVYEDFTYAGYNADKVAEPQWAGTNNFLVLQSITSAS